MRGPKHANQLQQPLLCETKVVAKSTYGSSASAPPNGGQPTKYSYELLSVLLFALEPESEGANRRSIQRAGSTALPRLVPSMESLCACITKQLCKALSHLCCTTSLAVWNKPLLLLSNAANYLFFLGTFNIFRHYGALRENGILVGLVTLVGTYLLTWGALWVNFRSRIAMSGRQVPKSQNSPSKIISIIASFSAAATFSAVMVLQDALATHLASDPHFLPDARYCSQSICLCACDCVL